MSEDAVKKEVRKWLENKENESPATLIWFERTNSGWVRDSGSWIRFCRPGTSDFVCLYINKHHNLGFLFIECKRPEDKFELLESQIKFRDKYHKRHPDVEYIVVQSVEELKNKFNIVALDAVSSLEFNP